MMTMMTSYFSFLFMYDVNVIRHGIAMLYIVLTIKFNTIDFSGIEELES
jgi:hypothetical protein